METPLEERVLTLELWRADKVDPDLYGRKGTTEPGLVKEHNDEKAERRGRKTVWYAFMGFMTLLNLALGIIAILDKLHLL